MQVHESKLVELLVELGVTTAPDWAATPGKVAAKVNNAEGGLAKYAPAAPLKDAALQKLYDEVTAHQGAGGTVDVLPGAATPAPRTAPKKKAKKKAAKEGKGGKGGGTAVKALPKRKVSGTVGTTTVTTETKAKHKVTGRPAADAPWDVQRKWYAKHPITITDRGPGVMRTVVDQLRAAGRGAKPKPITKADLLRLLKDQFPDRDPLKMETNLHNIIPGRLRRFYGIHVWRAKLGDNQVGYYIPKEDVGPQPKEGRAK